MSNTVLKSVAIVGPITSVLVAQTSIATAAENEKCFGLSLVG